MEKEWQFFLLSVLYGAEVCCVYDFIRGLRNTWRHGKILIAAEDLFFWIAVSVFLFTRLYKWNNGIPRWYFFAGIFLGMMLYAAAISTHVVNFVSFFLKRLKMLFSWVNIIMETFCFGILRFLGIYNGEKVRSKKEKSAKTCAGEEK